MGLSFKRRTCFCGMTLHKTGRGRRMDQKYHDWITVSLISGHSGSFQDDIYSIRRMWSYFQGFGKPFPGGNGIFCQGFWWSKPSKIRPLQALGGILLEMSSFQEQP
jgi:hypothetical protein